MKSVKKFMYMWWLQVTSHVISVYGGGRPNASERGPKPE